MHVPVLQLISYNEMRETTAIVVSLLFFDLFPKDPTLPTNYLSLQHKSLEASPLIALANPSGEREIRNAMQNNLYTSYTI